MTGYDAVADSEILQITNDITGKSDENSIDPADVGNNMASIPDGLRPFIAKINDFMTYTSTGVPSNGLGVEGDYYYRTNGGVNIEVYRKNTLTWDLQCTIPLGISYQDGIIIGLRTQIDVPANSVSVTAGNWAINNVIYSKSIPTFLTYDAPEVGSDRIDTIYANTSGQILLETGAPSGSPVKPVLPVDTIEVDSIYVPASGTGDAYLFSAGLAGSVPSIIKTFIEGDQDDVTLDNGYGKLTTTLTQESIFVCTVNPSVGQEYKIPSTMLLGSTLFGFPNPTTTNFTFKITLI